MSYSRWTSYQSLAHLLLGAFCIARWGCSLVQADFTSEDILVDRNSIEIFAASDQIYVPIPVSFAPENASYSYRILQGEAEQARIDTYELRSAWNKEMRR